MYQETSLTQIRISVFMCMKIPEIMDEDKEDEEDETEAVPNVLRNFSSL